MKERSIFEKLEQDKGKLFEKVVVGVAEDKKERKANTFNLPILPSIWVAEGKRHRRKRGENIYAPSGRREVAQLRRKL